MRNKIAFLALLQAVQVLAAPDLMSQCDSNITGSVYDYTDYENAGVVGLGFPCNQFKLQEPGRPSEVLNCYQYVRPGGDWTPHPNYFIFGKVDVNGDSADKLYKFLRKYCPPVTEDIGNKQLFYWSELDTHDITWNYGKFLIDANGTPRYRFGPTVTIDQIYPYVDELLAEM